MVKIYLPGKLVPRETKAMAVTLSLSPTVQPKCEDTSPTSDVITPMKTTHVTKHGYPPPRPSIKCQMTKEVGRFCIIAPYFLVV
jgi:hypothetical protein